MTACAYRADAVCSLVVPANVVVVLSGRTPACPALAVADSLTTFLPPVNPVETRGLEPLTYALQRHRSPN